LKIYIKIEREFTENESEEIVDSNYRLSAVSEPMALNSIQQKVPHANVC